MIAVVPASAQVYRFKSYTANTGLPNNGVYYIYQDSKGYIWFCTDAGAARYDGQNYEILNTEDGMLDGSVRGVVEDRHGNYWILTRGAASYYDGKQIKNYTTADGLPSNEIRSGLRDRRGTIWLGTREGLARFDEKTNRFISYSAESAIPKAPVWSIIEASDGRIWMGLRGGGLVYYDGHKFMRYGKEHGLEEAVFYLAEDRFGSLWIATGKGLFQMKEEGQFRRYGLQEGLPTEAISTVEIDGHDRVWFGTYGGGVCRLEKDGQVVIFNRKNGTPDNFITAILKDYEGNFWFGTRWTGAFKFAGERFANYNAEAGIAPGVVTGIVETSDGTIWLSSITNGLSAIMPNGKIKRITSTDGLLEDTIWFLYRDSKQRLWAGGMKGVTVYDGRSFTHFTVEQFGLKGMVSSIIEDSQGNIWLGSQTSSAAGIVKYDGKTFRLYTVEDGLPSQQINTFAIDRKKRLWVCTEQGLALLQGDRFISFTDIPNKHVLAFYEDQQGQYWVGTHVGICTFDGSKVVRCYDTKDGMVDRYINVITGQGDLLWIGTAKGLISFDGKQFKNYTVREGMIGNDIVTGVSLCDSKGRMWFATTEGAVCYLGKALTTTPKPPRTVVTGVQVKGAYVDVSPKISLDYDKNHITFEFVGLSFIDENAVSYSYMLEGFDERWSPVVKERFARFTNLPAGNYRFLVKSTSADGLWSEPQAILVHIAAPFWQTAWFRLLAVLSVVLLAYLVFRWRVRILTRRHQQRLALLRRMLDSIRVINAQLDLSTTLHKITEEAAELVQGIPGGVGLVKDGQVVFEQTWDGKAWEKTRFVFEFGQGIAGRAAAEARTIIVNNPREIPGLFRPDLVEKYDVKGMIEVPIINRRGQVVGVLDIRSRSAAAHFTEADARLLESLTHQAAVAIENAELYGALEEKRLMLEESLKELQRLYEREQQVSKTLQELNQMKTNFMIVTSHEMRTPLTVLKGHLELLLDGCLGKLSTPQTKSVQACSRTVERLIHAFNNILEVVKIEGKRYTMHLSQVDLKQLLPSIIEQVEEHIRRRKLSVLMDIPSELPKIRADQEKLQLVFHNLIQNAIKFTPDGGTIRLHATRLADNIYVHVEDTGIGVDPRDIERIFDKFYTDSDPMHHRSGEYEFGTKGSGLGLAIAKGYVDAHEGKIKVQSQKGKGSTFIVCLPIAGPNLNKEGEELAKVEEMA